MFVWTVHLEGGPRRVNHAAVAIEEKIYSFGGYCTGEDYEKTRPMDIHILDSVSYRWKSLPIPNRKDPHYSDVPYQRYGHTAVAYKECAYVWGGRNDSQGACNILYCFDTVALKWSKVSVSGTIPGARDGHSACILNHKMYIFGGYEEWLDRFSNEVHSFDFATKTWMNLHSAGSPAQWRDFQSGSAIGDTMYIFGGRSDRAGPWHTNNEVYCNKIQAFRSLSQNWFEPETTGQAPFGRRSHSAFVHNGMIYIFGGYNGLHDLHFNDLYRYNAETSEWSLVKVKGQGPCPRRRQCCCVIKDRVFLFGGTSPCTDSSEGTEFNLMDHSDLYVLDMAPSLKTLCQLVVLEHNLDTSNLPHDIRWELTAMTTNNTISRPLNSSG
ncbi:kelch domain-containing protein 3-like [Tubulanus polymorphus]|uniref:kelch domain-containing protein 3-like n=1 Tax=Tubulanus polymorphus TaxID=672921 RepID=UPI003DA5A79E